MYSVYWVKPQKQIKEYHGSYDTFEQAMQSIRDWWQENDYRPRYYRVIEHGQSFTIDYGLYNCFYEIEFESNEPTEEE
jgi:complete genome